MATETAKSHNKIHSQNKGCSHLQKSITVCRKNNKKTYPSSPVRLDEKWLIRQTKFSSPNYFGNVYERVH